MLFFFFQNLQAKSAELAGYETKLNNLHLKVDSCKYVNLYLTILTLWMLNTFSVDVMDFAGLKAINEESLAVKRNLNNEIEKVSNSFCLLLLVLVLVTGMLLLIFVNTGSLSFCLFILWLFFLLAVSSPTFLVFDKLLKRCFFVVFI